MEGCKKTAHSQNAINAHALFNHYFAMPSCSADYESEVDIYLRHKRKFNVCIICNRISEGFYKLDKDIFDPINILCDDHYKHDKNIKVYKIALKNIFLKMQPRHFRRWVKEFATDREFELMLKRKVKRETELRIKEMRGVI